MVAPQFAAVVGIEGGEGAVNAARIDHAVGGNRRGEHQSGEGSAPAGFAVFGGKSEQVAAVGADEDAVVVDGNSGADVVAEFFPPQLCAAFGFEGVEAAVGGNGIDAAAVVGGFEGEAFVRTTVAEVMFPQDVGRDLAAAGRQRFGRRAVVFAEEEVGGGGAGG